MILIDTGPLVALFDASDNYHRICLDILKDLDHPLLTVWPVFTEAFYLSNFSWKAQETQSPRGAVVIQPSAYIVLQPF